VTLVKELVNAEEAANIMKKMKKAQAGAKMKAAKAEFIRKNDSIKATLPNAAEKMKAQKDAAVKAMGKKK
jgi:hypothetical protein